MASALSRGAPSQQQLLRIATTWGFQVPSPSSIPGKANRKEVSQPSLVCYSGVPVCDCCLSFSFAFFPVCALPNGRFLFLHGYPSSSSVLVIAYNLFSPSTWRLAGVLFSGAHPSFAGQNKHAHYSGWCWSACPFCCSLSLFLSFSPIPSIYGASKRASLT